MMKIICLWESLEAEVLINSKGLAVFTFGTFECLQGAYRQKISFYSVFIYYFPVIHGSTRWH